ncbi:cytochrome P450 [Deinococcus maricopensis]|uniref:Cytochrome P450 n=1 Tax=Deinococcus maricopensis (strain DSM 21211 / LMG 22137 / NRRL B-23946 / LB-34) TaxID=709986 RepID=E8U4M8_DEIML|nr:cytochrome P450 [Deinococcus maricopensis]ADV68893.1 cytochrome P450 [Deinococcus maricopensis DSM 21211]
MRSWRDLPAPAALPGSGHLLRWSRAPLALLEEGARLGPMFRLQFGVPAVVGSCFTWNKRLLTDLDTFRSAGSFSRMVPYLSGGIILTDAPAHKPRRADLNRPFGPQAMTALRARVQAALHGEPPRGPFDALAWADRVTLRMLNAAYFSGDFDEGLLHAFLAPLRHPFPTPALPRPALFARVRRELNRLAERRLLHGGDDLLAHLARLPGGVQEARISLAAGHDTTTHTLAWTIWHLAQHPQWFTPEGLRPAVRETLRLYPPGWMGSRRLHRDVTFEGVHLPRGTLALYSPYLSARDPGLWSAPTQFRPERFEQAPPPWAYLPFGGGERVCLGMHLAHLLLDEALRTLLGAPLTACQGDPTPRPGVTLGPAGPLVVQRG